MKTFTYCLKTLFALAACLSAGSAISRADQISWADWTAKVVGTPSGGSATATLAGLGITVSYAGEVGGPRADGAVPNWSPTGTFSGGFVGNAPINSYGFIGLSGGQGVVDTITFSKPVVDPVMAIWSLGNAGDTASFIFQTTAPITIVCGGPSAQYAGAPIFGSGNTISGHEGNGDIEFNGTFTQISFTSTLEAGPGYGFTVGAASVPDSAIPLPLTCLTLLGLVVWSRFGPRQAVQRK